MAVVIRLSRGGTKKRPFYRIVIADRRMPRDGRFIERVGSYNPMLARDHAERVILSNERITHWLSKGAQPTNRVARFLAQAGLAPKPAIPEQTKKNQPSAKTLERQKEKAEKKQATAAPADQNDQTDQGTDNTAGATSQDSEDHVETQAQAAAQSDQETDSPTTEPEQKPQADSGETATS